MQPHYTFAMNQPRTLDWISHHDPESRDYPVRALTGSDVTLRKQTWRPSCHRLDQGAEGACVGFAWTNELLARPNMVKLGDTDSATKFARLLYHDAQRRDEWAGGDYPGASPRYEGSSIIAGAKAAQAAGYIGEYRWSFSINDLRDAVISIGPAVLGIPWYESMYGTTKGGRIEVGGRLVGGHAILVIGYHPNMRIRGESGRHEVFTLLNSWGPGYGRRGRGYISPLALAGLLADQGEACIPIVRNTRPVL